MSVPSQDPYRDNRKRGAQDRVFMNSKKFKESKDGQEKVPTLLRFSSRLQSNASKETPDDYNQQDDAEDYAAASDKKEASQKDSSSSTTSTSGDDKKRNTIGSHSSSSSSDDDESSIDGKDEAYFLMEDVKREARKTSDVDDLVKQLMNLNISGSQQQHSSKEAEKVRFNPLSDTALHTKADFCKEYVQHAAFNNISDAESLRWFNLLQKYAPEINWPLKEMRKTLKTGSKTIKLDLNVCHDAKNIIEIDICIKGCHAYMGEYATEIFCPNLSCRHPRYKPCTHGNCKGETAKMCNPFNRRSHNERIAYRVIYYKAVLAQLKELIYWSITHKKEVFDHSLGMDMFSRTRATENRYDGVEPEELIGDITESKQAMFHKEQMNEIFQQAVKEYPDLEDWSFILSFFYDGGVLFTRKSKSIWPLIMTILNCNPDVRNTAGLGQRLVFVHDAKVGCNAEQLVFSEVLVPELNLLGKGVVFTFDDHDGKKRNIFLQARLICHTYDTMALLKICKFPGIVQYIVEKCFKSEITLYYDKQVV